MTRDYAEFGRKGELEPIGVVDIGSNSVRLVIYEGAVRSPTPIFNEKVLCGLGRQLASTGHLGEEAVERALVALARFRAIARILRVKNIRAIATAACRDAVDGPEFIQRGEKALGRADVEPVGVAVRDASGQLTWRPSAPRTGVDRISGQPIVPCGPGDEPATNCSGFGRIRSQDDYQDPRTFLFTLGLAF